MSDLNSQYENLVLDSGEYTLDTEYNHVLQNLTQSIIVPENGLHSMYLQRMIISTNGLPNSKLFYISIAGANLKPNFITTNKNIPNANVVAIVPNLAGNQNNILSYESDDVTSVMAEFLDRQKISMLTLSVQDENGTYIKFKDFKPFFQFRITTSYSELDRLDSSVPYTDRFFRQAKNVDARNKAKAK